MKHSDLHYSSNLRGVTKKTCALLPSLKFGLQLHQPLLRMGRDVLKLPNHHMTIVTALYDTCKRASLKLRISKQNREILSAWSQWGGQFTESSDSFSPPGASEYPRQQEESEGMNNKLGKPQHSPEYSLALEHVTPREAVSPAVAHPEQCGLTRPLTAGVWLENPITVPRAGNPSSCSGPNTQKSPTPGGCCCLEILNN